MSTARTDRIRAIVTSMHGKVLSRTDDLMRVEIPADLAMAFMPAMIASGFMPMFTGQAIELAPRRIESMSGHTIVLDDEVTTAFYRYDIRHGEAP